MHATVALIMTMKSPMAIEALARSMPIWIADVPQHSNIRAALNDVQTSPPVTWFPLREQETLGAAANRIAFSLDDHHNELAQKDGGYKFLLVFGARFEPAMEANLGELGFRVFENTDFGFVAMK